MFDTSKFSPTQREVYRNYRAVDLELQRGIERLRERNESMPAAILTMHQTVNVNQCAKELLEHAPPSFTATLDEYRTATALGFAEYSDYMSRLDGEFKESVA